MTNIPKFDSVDIYTSIVGTESVFDNIGDLPFLKKKQSSDNQRDKAKQLSFLQRLWRIFTNISIATLIYLAILGSLTSLVALFTDWIVSNLIEGREMFVALTNNYLFGYISYIGYALFMAILSTSCVLYISAESAGSGIPEMKSILSGVVMNQYLSFKTLVSKIMGLSTAFGAGLSIGKEGPFVHMASSIAHQLLKVPIFSELKGNDFIRNQMFAAACAAGVSATFGAPFGGVLFSIEVTYTYYPVSTLWKGIFCSLFGTIFFSLFRYFGIGSDIAYTDFDEIPYKPIEYILFTILGIVGGIVGAFFVYVVKKLVRIRQTYKPIKGSKYMIVLIVCFLTAAFSYPMDPYLRGNVPRVLALLFGRDTRTPNQMIQLSVFCIVKFVLTACAIVLPIPCGLYVPVFVLGAGLGRLFGEIYKIIGLSIDIPFLIPGSIVPAGYAVVGAAAVAAGVTRTLSTAVVLFEVTGQLHFLVPVMISTVAATAIGNLFTPSIYDQLIEIRGLPHLTRIRNEKNYKLTAKDLMRKKLDAISFDDGIQYIENLLKKTAHKSYPVVENMENRILVGAVNRQNLEQIVRKYKYDVQNLEGKDEEYKKRFIETKSKIKFITKSPSTHFENPIYKIERKESDKYIPLQNVTIQDVTVLSEEEVNLDIDDDRKSRSFIDDSRHSFTSEKENWPIKFVTKKVNDILPSLVQYDPAPFTLSPATPITQVHFIFSMLGLSHAFIVERGVLLGVVAKKDLILAKL